MRKPPRRVILPSGELKRLRLPDGLGEEADAGHWCGKAKSQSLSTIRSSAVLGAGWLGLVIGCWAIAQFPPNLTHVLSTPLTDKIDWQANVGVARAAIQGPAAELRLGRVPSVQEARERARPPRSSEELAVVAARGEAAGSRPVSSEQARPSFRSSLPPVQYRVQSLHTGGRAGSQASGASVDAPEPLTQPMALAKAEVRSPSAGKAFRDALPGLLNDLPATQGGDWASGARTTAQHDPFEEDFQRSIERKAPTSFADNEPVRLGEIQFPRPARESGRALRADSPNVLESTGVPTRPPPGSSTGAGGVAVSHGGPGCQAAFDASEQQVDVAKPAVSDVTAAQYAAVVERVEVLRCRPRPSTDVRICAAVAEGRAVGVTVHTAPGDAALGRCLVKQVQRLAFPVGRGVDLVRTQLSID